MKNTSYSFRYQNKAAFPQVRTTSVGLQSLEPFPVFFLFFGIRFSTKVPKKWAIVKVGHNKGVVDCKFS
jgi:hypothetical protein